MKYLIQFLFAISSLKASATAVQDALTASGIKPSDSLEVKIDKALALLNEKEYFKNKGAPIKFIAPLDEPYHLDSLRTAEDIFSQKAGGSCGSSAKAFAGLLLESGVKDSDLQIVDSVVPADLKVICPEAGKPRLENPPTGARGHSFVSIRFPGKGWRLINPIDGSKNYGNIPWHSPIEVQLKIKQSALVVPRAVFQTLPKNTYGEGLVVFQAWSPKETPLHTFKQRFDLIASGRLSPEKDPKIKICRFTSPKQN